MAGGGRKGSFVFPFTLLRFRHWRAEPDALETEQIDRVGGFARRRPHFGRARTAISGAPSDPETSLA
jgi:hypothetical protein